MEERSFPIGTRIALTGPSVRAGLIGKIGTIVPVDDIKISMPSTCPGLNTIRMDDINDGYLYWNLTTPDRGLMIVEGPPEHSVRCVRCVIKEKELIAHTTAIKRLVGALNENGNENGSSMCDYEGGELLRCASAAIDKIAEMTKTPRGVELVPELER